MDGLQDQIFKEIKKTIPDVDELKARTLAEHLTSEEIGVRSLERLYDVTMEDMGNKLPRCDTTKLHRSWQEKYNPSRLAMRELQAQPIALYKIPWHKVQDHTIDELKAGNWPKKTDRCAMIRVIIADLLIKKPGVKRAFCVEVAKTMVAKYPRALHDRDGKLTDYSYLAKRLSERFDEEKRPKSAKDQTKAPNIPQAYGCIEWRGPISETERPGLIQMKEGLVQYKEHTRRKDWDWQHIQNIMEQTFRLLREDINSQTPPKKRRAPGAAQQPAQQIVAKSTKDISKEWPFLVQKRGMIQHFLILTKIDIEEKLSEFEEKFEAKTFIKFLAKQTEANVSIRTSYKKALKRKTCSNPHLVAILLMLVNYFKEDKEQIVREIESTTTLEEANEVDLPATPCLLSLGPVFKAKQFFFALDGTVLSSVKGFRAAFLILFAAYFTFNVKYASRAGHTLDFIQRVVAEIKPERGTKMRKKNYKRGRSDQGQTLLDKWATYLKETTDANEDQENEIEPMNVVEVVEEQPEEGEEDNYYLNNPDDPPIYGDDETMEEEGDEGW